ncbi:MAG: HupE/UreJ family protein [Bacteroidetes bacterium]|jgi:hypothetical protein|nr:HupE/UreJ family protein [Bacteroidota bacterium]
MEGFLVYLRLGFDHILDWAGYDHMLFLLALVTTATLASWRQLLILVTAFTVGHSITLAIATFDVYRADAALVETLIPMTIVVTSLLNLTQVNNTRRASVRDRLPYLLTLFFGLVHGLGFSNYLRAILGAEENLFLPLLAFNVGLEVGQLIVVAGILFVSTLVQNAIQIPRRYWIVFMSGCTFGISLLMALERMFG